MLTNFNDNGMVGIYTIKNKVNDKQYVGKSINIHRRILQHIGQLNSKSKDENRYLIASWHKYDAENFEYSVLEYIDEPDEELRVLIMKERELFWMDELKTLNRKFGYNLRKDSSSNMIVHQETRDLMSKNRKQRYIDNPHLRKEIGERNTKFWNENPIAKEAMSVKVSEIITKYSIVKFTREMEFVEEYPTQKYLRDNFKDLYLPAILQVCNGNKASYKGFYWRYKCVVTGDIVQQKERKTKTTPVVMLNKHTHEILKEFNSGLEAANHIGQKTSTNVSSMCINKTFYKKHDYYFRFKKEYEESLAN